MQLGTFLKLFKKVALDSVMNFHVECYYLVTIASDDIYNDVVGDGHLCICIYNPSMFPLIAPLL